MFRKKLALQTVVRYCSSMPGTVKVPARFRLQELLDAQEPPMSQSELARRSGVSLVTVNAIANNRTIQVSLRTLEALAAALGVEPGDIIGSEPEAKRGRR